MNEKKQDNARQEESAEVICARIKEESAQEATRILDRARQEAGKIISDASNQSEAARAQLLGGLRGELEKARERVFSGLNLEKKRLLLEEKNNFIRQVLDAVREQARQFRGERGYEDFLRKSIAEGLAVIGEEQLVVTYAVSDEPLFSSGEFIRSVDSFCRGRSDKAVTFSYVKGDFEEIGVIVSSAGGRIQFDNRFSSRLARLEGDIYTRLLKESF